MWEAVETCKAVFLAMNINWSSGAFILRKDVLNSIFNFVADRINYGSLTYL